MCQVLDLPLDTLNTNLIESHVSHFTISEDNTIWTFDSVMGVYYPKYSAIFEPLDQNRETTLLGSLRIIEPITNSTVVEMECTGFGQFSKTGKYFTVYDSLATEGDFGKPGLNYFVTRIYNIQGQLIAQRMPDFNQDAEFNSRGISKLIESIPGYIEYGSNRELISLKTMDGTLEWELNANDFFNTSTKPTEFGDISYYEWRIIEPPHGEQLFLVVNNVGLYGIDFQTGTINWFLPGRGSGYVFDDTGKHFYYYDHKDNIYKIYRSDGTFFAQSLNNQLFGEFRVIGDSLLIDARHMYDIIFQKIQLSERSIFFAHLVKSSTYNFASVDGNYYGRRIRGDEDNGPREFLIACTNKFGLKLPLIPINYLEGFPRQIQISRDGLHISFLVSSQESYLVEFVKINMEGISEWNVY